MSPVFSIINKNISRRGTEEEEVHAEIAEDAEEEEVHAETRRRREIEVIR
jgi:hypothetical protein